MTALHILAVDDTPQNLSLLQRFLDQLGHRVTTATTGQGGVEAFANEHPDLVLMDVMLPDISGIEAMRLIREIAGDRWVPIIFVSALSRGDDVVRGLEAGGDDYLTKPIDLTLLETKIRVMQRIAEMQERLQVYRDEAEQEQETAQALMGMMINATSNVDAGLHMWLEPAARFSGDLLVACRSPFGHLYLLHADSMGHGLTAALPLLPIAQTFRTMCERGITLRVIVNEMNTSLKRQIPRGFYVAATLACIDRHNRVIEVWNGGSPDALLIDSQGEVLRRFASTHVPLGILKSENFDTTTEIVQLSGVTADLVLYSDGLLEAQAPDGTLFGEERLLAALKNDGDRYAALVAATKDHLAGGRAHDDISLIATHCC